MMSVCMLGRTIMMSMTMIMTGALVAARHMAVPMIVSMSMAGRPGRARFPAGLQRDFDYGSSLFNQIADGGTRFLFRGNRRCDVGFPQHRDGVAARCGKDGSGCQHAQA